MNSTTIRKATAADRDAILSLLQDASLPTQDLKDTDAVQFWVAADHDRVVGVVGLERYAETGLLRSLVVAREARKRGIGLALVQAIENEAADEGLRQLVLLTQTAQPFFERIGYSVIARDAAPDEVRQSAEFRSVCPASATCMTKSTDDTRQVGRGRPMRILFLCTGNSCRSILAEATFNHLARPGWIAMSAGSQPTGRVHARSLALLAREGISTQGCCSKSWNDLPHTPDIVITVCSSAAGETCPAYLGPVLRTHWGVDDPAHATGTDEEIDAQFMKVYRTLRRRIEALFELPLAELQKDPAQLMAELDRIGATVE